MPLSERDLQLVGRAAGRIADERARHHVAESREATGRTLSAVEQELGQLEERQKRAAASLEQQTERLNDLELTVYARLDTLAENVDEMRRWLTQTLESIEERSQAQQRELETLRRENAVARDRLLKDNEQLFDVKLAEIGPMLADLVGRAAQEIRELTRVHVGELRADMLELIPEPVPGPPGEPGRGFRWRSDYDPEQRYAAMDVCKRNGSTWIATADEPGDCPGDGWELFVQRGTRGPRGYEGKAGKQGEPGRAAEERPA